MIAKELVELSDNNLELATHALAVKNITHQSKLSHKKDRLLNVQNAFTANPDIVKNRNIILLDDVVTTGATLSEAKKALQKAGAKQIKGFGLAH
jgi:competence protein ComFC